MEIESQAVAGGAQQLRLPYAIAGQKDVSSLEWANLLGRSGEFGSFDETELRNQVLSSLVPGAAAFVRSGREVVACAAVCMLPEFSPSGVLMYLYVHPEHRGNQLGEIVTRRVVSLAASAGCRRVLLHTDDERVAAIRVYLHIGFLPCMYRRSHRPRWRAVLDRLNDSTSASEISRT